MSSLKGGDIFYMASKGQKFNKYTKELKETILREFDLGYSRYYLEKKYGVPNKTIQSWRYQQQHPKFGKRGRPNNKEDIDYKERYEILKKYQAFLKAQREKK